MKSFEGALNRAIWDRDLASLPAWKAAGMQALRITYAIGRELFDGQLTLRATSLVYTTLLSMVPLLAVSFSVLKGFGVHNQFEPIMLRFLAPLGDKGPEITSGILAFVDNVKVGVLGSFGLALLFVTVISLVQKVESSFNYTWHTRQTRSLGERFSEYLSVVLVGPILIFTAMTLTASLSSNTVVERLSESPAFSFLLQGVGRLLPYLLVILAFTFVYVFIPNAKVKIRAALVGALVAGVLWETVGRAFAVLVASTGRYSAIYSGFATPILFMFWMYLGWLILLIGASIAFYVQHPEHLRATREDRDLSNRLKEKLALAAMARIARAQRDGDEPWTLDRLALALRVPADHVAGVLELLERQRVLVKTGDGADGWVPRHSPETLTVARLITAVRTAEESDRLYVGRVPGDGGVDRALEELDRALEESLGSRPVAELATSSSDQ